MSRADYAHWNEEADRVWWEEEGRHIPEPDWSDPDDWRGDWDDPEDDEEWED